MEILQVPYLHDKFVLRDLSEFLTKESNTLAADAKEIDNIRVQNKQITRYSQQRLTLPF